MRVCPVRRPYAAGMGAIAPTWRKPLMVLSGRRRPRVSVIIPAFNAMPYLNELLASLDDQGLSRRQLEVIIIDDGSTDDTAAVLEDYGRGRPNVTVLHQENSGWPGQPRNRGLGLARGAWIFFADADDYLAPGALAELADYGDQQSAQLVLPRVERIGTRGTGRPFRTTIPAARKKTAFRTFTPHKLVRHELIKNNDVRFPEGKIRLEDGIFFSRCYLLADKISILANRSYYMLRGRADGGNISRQRIDPDLYMVSLGRIAQNVYDLSSGPEMTTALITELLRRKCFRLYIDRFDRLAPAGQHTWLAAHLRFFTAHVTPEIRAALAPINQERLDLVLAQDRPGMLAHIRSAKLRPLPQRAALAG
jgi:poly(ribitol-phosphate) beta-N-acetylglucosaminyltransferase